MSGAVLIIDAQVAPFTGSPKVHHGKETLANINRLAELARSHSMNVIFIQHNGPEGSPMEPLSDGWQLHHRLKMTGTDLLVRKTASDAFHDTELDSILSDLSIKELYLAGYATELCVDTTARRAASLGYKTTLVADAHTTRNRPSLDAEHIITHHQWVLSNLVCPGNPISVKSIDELEHEFGAL